MRAFAVLSLLLPLLGWQLVPQPLPAVRSTERILFNRDIRPILSENCFQCHGPDSGTRKANLRLDDRDAAVKMEAIVPGKPDDSELIARIDAEDDLRMPPAHTGKQLKTAERELLRRWIVQGAEYQPHWAYLTPSRPAVPKEAIAGEAAGPIDAFILEKLRAAGLQPAPTADRRTLIRRVTLDLTGLPPTPEEVANFLADSASDAYEKVVERLLASPRYGERMAVPWLDAVRYADTVGYHGDQNVNIFPYRDYVITAFNENKPFDEFTIEQLAGDLLPNATPTQRVASGFNRLNMMTREGGAQPKEYLAKYAADRVRTVAGAWLGSTVGCAECHDHKFDPFTMRDFYSLSAYFADLKQWGVYSDYSYTPNPDLRGWTNDHPFPPELEVDSPYLQRRMQRLEQDLDGLAHTYAEIEPAGVGFHEWAELIAAWYAEQPSGWKVPTPTVEVDPLPAEKKQSPPPTPAAGTAEAEGEPPPPPPPPPPAYRVETDGSVILLGSANRTLHVTVPLDGLPWLTAVRFEVLPHAEHNGKLVRSGTATPTVRPTVTYVDENGKKSRLNIWHADAAAKRPIYRNGFSLLGIHRGWALPASKDALSSVWLLQELPRPKPGAHLVLTLANTNLGCVRLAVAPLAPEDARRPEQLADLREQFSAGIPTEEGPTRGRFRKLFLASANSGQEKSELRRQYLALAQQWLDCRDGKALTLVSEARDPLPTRILPRGNWLDESGPLVEPAPPAFLPQTPAAGERPTRLDLARWLVAPEHPLTARAFVNRLWAQFFGNGLSAVLDDLGAQGEWPTHPELLDWLAVEFRESGWNIKHVVKQMVLSHTYRQSSTQRADAAAVDPENRLLARQNPRRLEAEFIRDQALAVAGLLDAEIGGPSSFPYQPKGYYANLQFPDRDYFPSLDERQYRRGLYSHWQRTFLHPMLANFDAPSREECTCFRTLANTPQQALTLLNDPTFVEAARVLAARVVRDAPPTDEQRLAHLFELLLSRPPNPPESQSLREFVAQERERFAADLDAARKLLAVGNHPLPSAEGNEVELAAWSSVCRVLLNLHETITRN